MKPGLAMQQGRQLTVGPMLQKSLHFLQLNAIEFAHEVNALLDANPLLESEESTVAGDVPIPQHEPVQAHEVPAPADDSATAGTESRADTEPWAGNESDQGSSWGEPGRRSDGEPSGDWLAAIAQTDDLRDHLKTQIAEMHQKDSLRLACAAVVDSLDDRGYLRETAHELRAGLAEAGIRISLRDVENAIGVVRTLNPAGMAARDLVDCLQMQLAQRNTDEPAVGLARRIIRDHLDLLGQSNFRQIGARLDCSEAEMRDAVALIKQLDPVPGRQFDNSRVDFVVPDLTVVKVADRWVATPTSGAAPRLRLNDTYAAILNEHRESSGSPALREKLQEARWLLRSIEQRNRTILAVGAAIVERQQKYFDYGDIALTPMTLADIAGDVGAHESTVSRVVNSKYLVCPTGLKPMKMFFTSHVHTKAGAACSASAVKAMIQRIIENEPADAPISDHKLAGLLSDRGIRIARRTVSKYRMAMGIQAYELRR